MKELVFVDTCANQARYRLRVPDAMKTWKLESFLDYMGRNQNEALEQAYLPKPAATFEHEIFRQLVSAPAASLNHPLKFSQYGTTLEADDSIDLSNPSNEVFLDRRFDSGGLNCESLSLKKRNRRNFEDCAEHIVPIFDTLFDFERFPIETRDGRRVASVGELTHVFGSDLDEANQVRFLYRVSRIIHGAPFENISKILVDKQLRGGLAMWENILGGFGGVCSEKTLALKFVCDSLGIQNSPVFGSTGRIPRDIEKRLTRYVESEGEEKLDVWIQHHLLKIEIGERSVLIDATNGNIPFTFLFDADAALRVRCGMRARMVYRVERMHLTEVSDLAGDIMLTISEFHVPDLHFQFMFQHGLGLHISENAYLGVYFDWGGERSALMQNYYSRAARRLRLPYPRFVHAANMSSVPDENLSRLLNEVLQALRARYEKREYTGDFTFVIQPLTSDRWRAPHVSRAAKGLLWPGKENS